MGHDERRPCRCGCGHALPRDRAAYVNREHYLRHRARVPVPCKGCGGDVADRRRVHCETCREARPAQGGPGVFGQATDRGAAVAGPDAATDWRERALAMGEDEMRRHLGLDDRLVREVLLEQARRTRKAAERQRRLAAVYRPGAGA